MKLINERLPYANFFCNSSFRDDQRADSVGKDDRLTYTTLYDLTDGCDADDDGGCPEDGSSVSARTFDQQVPQLIHPAHRCQQLGRVVRHRRIEREDPVVHQRQVVVVLVTAVGEDLLNRLVDDLHRHEAHDDGQYDDCHWLQLPSTCKQPQDGVSVVSAAVYDNWSYHRGCGDAFVVRLCHSLTVQKLNSTGPSEQGYMVY